MNPKKQKEKDRRRARKLAEEAWEAVDSGNLDLAEKIIRRAVAAQADNPVLWNDHGAILALRRKEAEAAESFRAAIGLAPTFADPYAALAALRFQQGFVKEAVALQTQAARHAPNNATYAEKLDAFRSFVPSEPPKRALPPTAPPVDYPYGDWPNRLDQLNWPALGQRLTCDGCVLIPSLVDPPVCEQLRRMFDEDAMFAKTVEMDRADYGRGVYRYFQSPIPAVVDQLRRAVYPHVARIANDWQQLLGEHDCYPLEWEEFREVCSAAGQMSPTPILLKYTAGGFNALHRDLRGTVYFPIQMAVVLSPRTEPAEAPGAGFMGGEFRLHDVPEGKKSRCRELTASLGDAVLFCTRDRLVRVGDVYGLQPVKHGVATITAGTRYVLGVPFHEYR
jgi:hypothetical protein